MFSKFRFYLVYLVVLCVVIHLIDVRLSENSSIAPPKFNLITESINIDSDKLYVEESELIPQPKFLKMAHSVTFAVLNNGDLQAFWFAGSHEGQPDVKIWSSKYIHGKWTMATQVLSPGILSEKLGFYVKKIGNPAVYHDTTNNRLYLFVVSVGGIGGWAGSRLNYITSDDDGYTWSNPKMLVLSPFFNISTLNRTLGLSLSGGGFYLPVYHEMMHTYPELIRFDPLGNFIGQIRMTSQFDLLQPAVLPITDNIGYGFFRNNTHHNDILYMQATVDGGVSWNKPIATNLHNHDSSIAVYRLNYKNYLMVHNVGNDRSKLVLAKSHDGVFWNDFMVLENDREKEFSYPVIIAHDGFVDILYTWQRKQIKHVRLLQMVLS